MMASYALYSIKGGVGKTAAAVNLAHLAANDNFYSLLIDLDPQASASYYFRIRPSKKLTSKQFVKGGKKIDKNIKSTDYEKLDSLPANFSYRKLDIVLDNQKRPRKKIKDIIQPLKKDYDFIFIDCPPNITLASESVFNAVDVVLVPIIPTTLSVLMYDKLLDFFSNKKLDMKKIIAFFSMVEKRKKLHKEIMKELYARANIILEHYIPYCADVEKMGIYRQPVACFSPKSLGATSYKLLLDELKEIKI